MWPVTSKHFPRTNQETIIVQSFVIWRSFRHRNEHLTQDLKYFPQSEVNNSRETQISHNTSCQQLLLFIYYNIYTKLCTKQTFAFKFNSGYCRCHALLRSRLWFIVSAHSVLLFVQEIPKDPTMLATLNKTESSAFKLIFSFWRRPLRFVP